MYWGATNTIKNVNTVCIKKPYYPAFPRTNEWTVIIKLPEFLVALKFDQNPRVPYILHVSFDVYDKKTWR